jgi:hypothetical protein
MKPKTISLSLRGKVISKAVGGGGNCRELERWKRRRSNFNTSF